MATNYERIAGTPEKLAALIARICDQCQVVDVKYCTDCPMQHAKHCNLPDEVLEWLQEEADDTENA